MVGVNLSVLFSIAMGAFFLNKMSEESLKNVLTILRVVAAFNKFEEIRSKNLPDEAYYLSTRCSDTGWYFWPVGEDFSSIIPVSIDVKRLDDGGFNMYMANVFRKRIGAIKEEIGSRASHRNKQICDVFTAHELGLYFASIPGLLSVADGACMDEFRFGLYRKENKQTKISKKLEADAQSELDKALFKCLCQSKVLTMQDDGSDSLKRELNRNHIMHGSSWEYGTELNSLKSISLVHYVYKAIWHIKGAMDANCSL